MSIYELDGTGLKHILMGSASFLASNKAEIDALNVFPVPDGDTGTNMYLTLKEAAKAAQEVESNELDEVINAAANGALMGARGNSGVILSQVIRGFANALKGKKTANAKDIACAIEEGAMLSYKAVSEPVEGTVLTVLRKSAEAAHKAADRSSDLVRFMVSVFRQATKALEQTPEQLKVLKEAGVVDAGGKGWVVILQGILYTLKKAEQYELLHDFTASQEKRLAEYTPGNFDSDIMYTYCTEFLLKGSNLSLERIKTELQPYGDCLMVVGSEQLAKIHIHSNHPGLVIETCLNYGALQEIKISNMQEQNKNLRQERINKKTAVIAVALGEGIINIMESLGVDYVISGGQTMNPSTEDILQAVEKAPSDKVIILPNNKNIIMAAEQAAKMTQKLVSVIPTQSTPQGLSALLAYNPEDDLSENAARMNKAICEVKTGEITFAVRKVNINGCSVNTGDIIGLIEGKLVSAGNDMYNVLKELVQKMVVNGEELVTLYYGEELNGEAAREAAERLQEDLDVEVEVHYGGQPLYPYILSVE
ncbi:MAG: DAK2 domain-containing protein [Desulfotomaculum sp.]|nr:DAK2 domain-containing protein [Desulfotomaculum sp.]